MGVVMTRPTEKNLAPGRHLVPFGKNKGEYLDDTPTSSLVWLRGKIDDAIQDPERSSYKAKNIELLTAIDCVLRDRDRRPSPGEYE